MVFRAWMHERASLNLQWLVLRIGGGDFLHCWFVDSIWLECAESWITKISLDLDQLDRVYQRDIVA